MINSYTCQNKLSFTSRCPQIRDAQWVCHKVNEIFPHESTTKFKPLFEKQLRRVFGKKVNEPAPLPMDSIKRYIREINIPRMLCPRGFKEKLKQNFMFLFRKYSKDDLRSLYYIDEKIVNLGNCRTECDKLFGDSNELLKVLRMFEVYKLGNCSENATITELILKLNGVENARTMHLKYKSVPEHAVCVFNIDGSPFEKIINNKSIIIDPWAGKADFANNMIKFYKNMLNNNFLIDTEPHLRYDVINSVELQPSELSELRGKYPQLLFQSKNHRFMQKQ